MELYRAAGIEEGTRTGEGVAFPVAFGSWLFSIHVLSTRNESQDTNTYGIQVLPWML